IYGDIADRSGFDAPDDAARLAKALDVRVHGRASEHLMPGQTGEMNRLTLVPRSPVLCLGPGPAAAQAQVNAVRALGGLAVAARGKVEPQLLESLPVLSAVLWWGDAEQARALAQALVRRDGPIVPLITALPDAAHVLHERHLCVDTTAAGGNAALLAG
ncbi:MAG: bifunctional proline dehydrogenase/L-glutamate gamma-semialdehyde dehydrogenase, partial [Paracoccus sp. (in: a-proteobacteria)]|nr:bifunctional proline dehydrogenase/L-glutamate gamma-semialdehyde dehydrogenase [Paracoccus sp. (in: a-proteobacteria)]